MIRTCLKYSFRHFHNANSEAHSKHRHINLRKDYYKMLEISSVADETQIKKSYFRLAKIWHPDINSKGHVRFTQIQEAYNILSDQQTRHYYDSNNQFYPYDQEKQKRKRSNNSQSQNQKENVNYRDQAFYEELKRKKWDHVDEEEMKRGNYQKDKNDSREEEDEETARKRKRFEDEINLVRQKLFTRNPIWERANAFMNHQERQKRIEEKRQELENMFPKTMKIAESFRRWIFGH